MKTERYDKQQALEWCFRYGVPSLAGGLVLAFFAFAGSVSTRESVLMMDAASSPLISNGEAVRPSVAASESHTQAPKTDELAVVLREAPHLAGAARHARR